MNDIIIPIKALSKIEQSAAGIDIAERLLEIHDAKTAYTLVAQAQNVFDSAKEALKERAIVSVVGKSEIILGAEVSLRGMPKKYEYKGTRYDQLFNAVETAKEALKTHTKILEMSKDGWINPETGETESASVVSGGGMNIAVKFNQ